MMSDMATIGFGAQRVPMVRREGGRAPLAEPFTVNVRDDVLMLAPARSAANTFERIQSV
jgi:hypothetical protein